MTQFDGPNVCVWRKKD